MGRSSSRHSLASPPALRPHVRAYRGLSRLVGVLRPGLRPARSSSTRPQSEKKRSQAFPADPGTPTACNLERCRSRLRAPVRTWLPLELFKGPQGRDAQAGSGLVLIVTSERAPTLPARPLPPSFLLSFIAGARLSLRIPSDSPACDLPTRPGPQPTPDCNRGVPLAATQTCTPPPPPPPPDSSLDGVIGPRSPLASLALERLHPAPLFASQHSRWMRLLRRRPPSPPHRPRPPRRREVNSCRSSTGASLPRLVVVVADTVRIADDHGLWDARAASSRTRSTPPACDGSPTTRSRSAARMRSPSTL